MKAQHPGLPTERFPPQGEHELRVTRAAAPEEVQWQKYSGLPSAELVGRATSRVLEEAVPSQG